MATTVSSPVLDQNVSHFVAKTHKILINGQWVEAASGKTFPTYNPSTGDTLSRVAEGDREDIDRAVKAARAAFEAGPWGREMGHEVLEQYTEVKAVCTPLAYPSGFGCT